MEVRIKDKTYQFNVRSWWGPLYTFEEIMDVAAHPERRFNPASTLHLHTMLYCVLLNDNDALDLTLDEFFESLNDMALCSAMTEFFTRRASILLSGGTEKDSTPESKKKRSRRTSSTNA